MEPIGEPTSASPIDRIASLMRSFVYPESLPGILKHLRHEGQVVQPAPHVQSAKDLLLASYFYPVAGVVGHSIFHPSCGPPGKPSSLSEALVSGCADRGKLLEGHLPRWITIVFRRTDAAERIALTSMTDQIQAKPGRDERRRPSYLHPIGFANARSAGRNQ